MTDPKEIEGSTIEAGKETTLKVTVDSEQMKKLLSDLDAEEKKSKKLTEDLAEALKAKETAETTLEEKTTEAEDFKSKLTIIGEAKLKAKREIILAKAKELIKDEDRLKEIEKGMEDAKGVKATEFMIETLSKTLEEGRIQREALEATQKLDETKKTLLTEFPDAKDKIEGAEDIEALENLRKELTPATPTEPIVPPKKSVVGGPAGVTKLSPAQLGTKGEGYDSYQAMIHDLRRMENSDNPEEAAYAKEVLDEMFKRWTIAVKKRYEGKSQGFDIEAGITEGLEQPSLKEMTALHRKEKPKRRD